MDELIQKLLKDKKISVFPIKDKDWKDTGNWSSYFDIFKKMQKTNILIIGYGAIGKQYHSLLQKNFKIIK